MNDVKILPAVLKDIADAAARYDNDGYHGLGDRFIATFYSYLPFIQKHGHICRISYKDFRKILIKPFPYSVFFRLHEEVWIISLVIHAARRPSRARRMLQKRK
jgi:toxin ParE1/3/4